MGTGGPAAPPLSQRRPQWLAALLERPTPAAERVLTLPVHALSLEEAVALARELPNLRDLLHTDPAGPRADAARTATPP